MNPVKNLMIVICLLGISACSDRNGSGSPEDRESFDKTKALIHEGFAKGDVKAVLALHHPDVVKYFGEKILLREQKD